PRDVPTASWKRPISGARDLEHGKVVVNRLQPRSDLRRLFAHQAYGLLRKDVCMYVDRAASGHPFPSLWPWFRSETWDVKSQTFYWATQAKQRGSCQLPGRTNGRR